MKQLPNNPSRRDFVGHSMACGAWVGLLSMLSPVTARRVFAQTQEEVVATEKWGRIEKVAENMWALISVLDEQDYTTVCNGGVIAGDRGVLAVETFMTSEGSAWLAEWAEKLTGRRPTDVVVTHYHDDHSKGIDGYTKDGESPAFWITQKTSELIHAKRPDESPPENLNVVNASVTTTIDLGSRQIKVNPRSGHTASDITVEVTDPNIIWTGDLFFNRMVPNFMDASPADLKQHTDALLGESDTLFVPGHGPVADTDALTKYRELLSMIEDKATRAHEAGKGSEQAAAEFTMPTSFREWFIYSDQVMPNAYAAWYRQLDADQSR